MSLIEVFMTEKRTCCQYPPRFKEEAGALYQNLLASFGIRPSMGDVGACRDDAVVERVFGRQRLDKRTVSGTMRRSHENTPRVTSSYHLGFVLSPLLLIGRTERKFLSVHAIFHNYQILMKQESNGLGGVSSSG
ncbi:MAG: hypothetical protein ACJA2D_001612 [Pseudohongiellaceae bacterium]|jgi:hypothetical protein